MTLKSDAKLKEKLTCSFKHDLRNLVNFHPTTQNFESFTLRDCFCSKYKGLRQTNTEELSFMTLNSDVKFE